MKLIASLTTIPSRVKSLPLVVESIFNQNVPIDEVHLNIPYKCLRTNEDYNLTELNLQDPRINVHRTPDFGAITKIGPTLLRQIADRQTFVVSVDDDFVYPNDTVEKLLEGLGTTPRIVTLQGGALSSNGDIQFWYGTGTATLLEGFAGVLYPPNVIYRDFSELLNFVMNDHELVRSDDVVLSTYFNYHNIEIFLNDPMSPYGRRDISGGKLPTADVDALNQEYSLQSRLSMYRSAHLKTQRFLDSFWKRAATTENKHR